MTLEGKYKRESVEDAGELCVQLFIIVCGAFLLTAAFATFCLTYKLGTVGRTAMERAEILATCPKENTAHLFMVGIVCMNDTVRDMLYGSGDPIGMLSANVDVGLALFAHIACDFTTPRDEDCRYGARNAAISVLRLDDGDVPDIFVHAFVVLTTLLATLQWPRTTPVIARIAIGVWLLGVHVAGLLLLAPATSTPLMVRSFALHALAITGVQLARPNQ